MHDLLGKLCSSISTAEGFFTTGPSLPKRNNNPGDLRSAPWLAHAPISEGFVHFSTPAQGIAGLYHQVALDIARGASLKQLIYKWAPPSENNTSNYLTETARRVGIIDVDQPLQNFLEIEKIP